MNSKITKKRKMSEDLRSNKKSKFPPNYGINKLRVYDSKRVEQKGLTTISTVAPIPILGQINYDNTASIINGTGRDERIGTKIFAKSFQLKGTFYQNPDSTSNGTFRIIIFVDKLVNGETPAVTDVISGNSVNSLYNLNQNNRFIILHDEHLTMPQKNITWNGTSVVNQAQSMPFRFYKKLGFTIGYQADSGTVSSIQSNGIGVLLISDSVSQHNFTYVSRIIFTDE